MKRFDFDGTYDEYAQLQKQRALQKWQGKSAVDKWFDFKCVIKNVLDMANHIDSICCMGIRSGGEYNILCQMKDINAEIYGVDIERKVKEVGKNCFCYDFSILPKGWSDKFDIVYSNSLDHALNVQEALAEWHRVAKKGGYIVLLLSKAKNTVVDINQFEKGDEKVIFDRGRFDVVKVFDKNFFNVVLKVKK